MPHDSGLSTRTGGSSTPAHLVREPTSRRLSTEFWWTATWCVYLAGPVILTITLSDAGPVWDAMSFAATGVFAVVYVALMPRMESFLGGRQGVRRLGALLLACLPLVLVVLPTVPSLGISVTSFSPYFAALGVYQLRPWGALAWALAVVAVDVAITLLNLPESGISWTLVGSLAAIGVIMIVRLIVHREESDARQSAEADAVREREAISRDVHDVLGHTLTVVVLKTQLARRTLRSDPGSAERELDEVLALSNTALDDVRATVGRLRTPDLAAQLESVRQTLSGVGVLVTIRGSYEKYPPDWRAVCAWAVREASTNLMRHAEANECTFSFGPTAFEVVDDGIGPGGRAKMGPQDGSPPREPEMDVAAEGHGLTGLRRRVVDEGGSLHISSAYPDRKRPGTRLRIEFE